VRATAIVTITRARSAEEAAALKASLEILQAAGLPIFAGDGGSIAAFQEMLQAWPSMRLSTGLSTLAGQVKAAVQAAAGQHRYVLYTEPDKRDFFAAGLVEFCRAAESDSRPVIVAARDAASFATFPSGQQATERAFNTLLPELLGLNLPDSLYGPILFDLQMVGKFMEAVPDSRPANGG
jgi:hypothetical protein